MRRCSKSKKHLFGLVRSVLCFQGETRASKRGVGPHIARRQTLAQNSQTYDKKIEKLAVRSRSNERTERSKKFQQELSLRHEIMTAMFSAVNDLRRQWDEQVNELCKQFEKKILDMEYHDGSQQDEWDKADNENQVEDQNEEGEFDDDFQLYANKNELQEKELEIVKLRDEDDERRHIKDLEEKARQHEKRELERLEREESQRQHEEQRRQQEQEKNKQFECDQEQIREVYRQREEDER